MLGYKDIESQKRLLNQTDGKSKQSEDDMDEHNYFSTFLQVEISRSKNTLEGFHRTVRLQLPTDRAPTKAEPYKTELEAGILIASEIREPREISGEGIYLWHEYLGVPEKETPKKSPR